MGRGRDGAPGPNFQPGMELRAAYTIFAEGCRGSLTKRLLERFRAARPCNPQTYALGCKELWEVPAGSIIVRAWCVHTIGWPLDAATYGGSFVYHWGDDLVSYGFVVGLDYRNPWLSPFEEMQRFKTHPDMRGHFAGGRRIAYGARALSEGGWQSLPKLTFPGGCLVGDAAGFLNVPKIKGTHTAMKSGMLAAEAVAEALAGDRAAEPVGYEERLQATWLSDELHRGAQHPPRLSRSSACGAGWLNARCRYLRLSRPRALDAAHRACATTPRCWMPLRRGAIEYPKPDGMLTFDRLVLGLHQQHQPRGKPACASAPARPGAGDRGELETLSQPRNRATAPPASMKSSAPRAGEPRLQINAQNCVHCKTCDIKDPTQNIDWVTPEGGGGPNYPSGM